MKQISKWFLGMGLVLLLVTGCSKKGGGTVVDSDGNPINPIFQIWMSGSSEEIAFFQALGDQFEGKMGISGLEVRVVNFDTPEMLQDMVFEMGASGKGPDVVFTDSNWIYLHRDKLVPLRGDSALTPSWFYEKFVRSAHQYLVSGDAIYGVPMAVNTLGLIYNEDHILSRLPDKNTPGVVWTDFRRDVERLTDLEKGNILASGAALGRGDNVTRPADILENMMLQYGGNFFDVAGTKAVFHDQKGRGTGNKYYNVGEKALEYYLSFSDTGYKNFSWDEGTSDKTEKYADYDAFIAGKTSMVFGYPEDVEWIEDRISRS